MRIIRLSVWTNRPNNSSERLESKPGSVEKHDYEYVRNGVCNIFMSNEPLKSKRFVKVTERKQKQDWAHFIEEISNQYSHAKKITLVINNF